MTSGVLNEERRTIILPPEKASAYSLVYVLMMPSAGKKTGEDHGKKLGEPRPRLANAFARLFAKRDDREAVDFQRLSGCHCPARQQKKLCKKKEEHRFLAPRRGSLYGRCVQQKGA